MTYLDDGNLEVRTSLGKDVGSGQSTRTGANNHNIALSGVSLKPPSLKWSILTSA